MICFIARTFESNPTNPPDWWKQMRAKEDTREQALIHKYEFESKHPYLNYLLNFFRKF